MKISRQVWISTITIIALVAIVTFLISHTREELTHLLLSHTPNSNRRSTELSTSGRSATIAPDSSEQSSDIGISREEALGLSPDNDDDEIVDLFDNCPYVSNPNQLDTDGDGFGDACSGLSNQLDRVQQDLAKRLGIADSEVKVMEIVEVIWPNLCLGVPAYEGLDVCGETQVPGYQITLRTLGQKYRYHTDKVAIFKFIGSIDAPQ